MKQKLLGIFGCLMIFTLLLFCNLSGAINVSNFRNYTNKFTESRNYSYHANELDADIIVFEGGEKLTIRVICEDEGDQWSYNFLGIIWSPYIKAEIFTNYLSDGRLLIITTISFNPMGLGSFTLQVLKNEVVLQEVSGEVNLFTVDFDNPPNSIFNFIKEDFTISFDASESYDPDGGEILYYIWDFGDGTITLNSKSTIFHTYNQMDKNVASLTVVDDEGLGDTISKQVFKLQLS